MCYVTKAMSLNGKCHKKQLKSRKSHKTCLTNHSLLVIIVLRVDIQRYVHIPMHEQKLFQGTRCALAIGQHMPDTSFKTAQCM